MTPSRIRSSFRGSPRTVTGTTAGFTHDYDEVCPYGGSTAPDVVYRYAPAANVPVNIDLCYSSYDTKLYVYQDAVTPGAPLACNDDFYTAAPCYMYSSKLENVPFTRRPCLLHRGRRLRRIQRRLLDECHLHRGDRRLLPPPVASARSRLRSRAPALGWERTPYVSRTRARRRSSRARRER